MKKKNSIITIFVLITIILLAIIIAFLFVFFKNKTNLNTQGTGINKQDEVQKQSVIIKGEEFNTYRNEEFGFEFKFPKDWEVKENTFGSPVSLFNMFIWPIENKYLPEPVSLNVITPEWTKKVEMKLNIYEKIYIDNKEANGYKITSMGLPEVDYIVKFEDYSIVIGGKEHYLIELDGVIESFRFLNQTN